MTFLRLYVVRAFAGAKSANRKKHFGAKCLYMVALNVWPDLEQAGWIIHVDFDSEESIKNALSQIQKKKAGKQDVAFYGNGHAAEKIADCMEQYIRETMV